jgi:hypothetical protein
MSRIVGYYVETEKGELLEKTVTIREALSVAFNILPTKREPLRVVRINDGNHIYAVSMNTDNNINIEKLRYSYPTPYKKEKLSFKKLLDKIRK